MASVTEMPPAEAQETPFDPPKEETPPPGSAKPAKNRGGRPPKSAPRPPEGKAPEFFSRVAAISTADWGTRAFMYLYIEEPVCVANTWGKTSYAKKFFSPILDLEPLKQLYGSFKGWLSLNTRKSGKDVTDQIDRLDFEIFDPHCPPLIPRKAWANDSRNLRWEALLPPEPKPPSEGATSLLDSIKVYKEIRDDLKDEMGPPPDEEPMDRTRETLETMKLAKELFAPAAPATAPIAFDPFETAKKIMDMRANDPMVAALMLRLDASDKQAEAARQREFDLQLRLMEAKTGGQSKGLVEQLLELAAIADKLEPLKKVFGFGAGAVEAAAVRVAKTTWYDMVKDIAASPFGSNLGQGLGMVLSNLAARGAQANGNGQPHPIVMTGPNPNGTVPQAESVEQRIQRIGQQMTQPMLYEYFLKDLSGEEFAESMFNLYPEDYMFMRNLGADNLVERYRRFTPAWAVIAPKETAFIEFIQEFCKWSEQVQDAPPSNDGEGVTDLEDNS